MIKSIFDKAEANDMVLKSPARHIEKPKGTDAELRALTPEERRVFEEVSKTHKMGDMLCMTFACGLRPQEVRALKWENIDFIKKRIFVKNAIEGGKNIEKETKTKAGVRKVPIPAWYLDRLLRIKKDEGIVFPSSATGEVMTTQNYYRLWHAFKRKMDVALGAEKYRNQIKIETSKIDTDLSPYYLRHTYCTDLAVSGVDLKTASYLMGHSSIAVTAKIYTHVNEQMLLNAEKVMYGQKGDTPKIPRRFKLRATSVTRK